LSDQVILDIFIFSLDEIKFMNFLLLKFLQLILIVSSLYNIIFTSDLSY
jgi:hypothetical protein